MSFPARYAGKCDRCGEAIQVGTQITWSRRQKGKAYHAHCATKAEPVGVESPKEVVKTETQNDALGAMATAMLPYLSSLISAQAPVDEDKIKSIAKEVSENVVHDLTLNPDEIQDFVRSHVAEKSMTREQVVKIAQDAYTSLQPLTVRVENPKGETQEISNAHEKMPHLLYLVSKKHHVYLFGGPGSGKSTAAKQVADALNIRFGYISLNPQTPDSRLMGFLDANGTYRETVFYQLYRDGGVFCIDEMDNASPSLLTTLNSCLENGHAAFPNGMVPRHKDFVVVATGNTCGKGANAQFPDRRPFDAAFSERFSFIQWEYDTKLEKNITLNINPNAEKWFEWVQNTRKHCAKNHPRVLVSPRASFKGAEYLLDSTLTMAQIAEYVVFKGADQETVQSILRQYPLPNRS